MANTRLLTTEVENYVRSVLQEKHGIEFTKQRLELLSGGVHEFDAVSSDRTIVTSIKSASGMTSGGNLPSGKINSALAELYFLTLVKAPIRELILTTEEFHRILSRNLTGKIASGIELIHLPLPPELQARVSEVQRIAGAEVSPL
jgi:hypothetical protein